MSKTINRQQKQNRALTIGSSIASLIAKFVTYPIDTVKSKVQVNRMKIQTLQEVKLGNAIQVARRTFESDGIKGFYRGVTISAFGSIIAFSCYMTAYERAKQYLDRNGYFWKNQFLIYMASGFFAQIVSCSLWLPIDIIKERLQVQSQLNIYKYEGPRDAMRKIHISEGISGLYRAFGATLLFFGPFSALFFAFYQNLKKVIPKNSEKPKMIESIMCSAGASAVAGFITTPLEIVKLRMQIQRADVATHGGSLEKSVFGYRNAFHGLGQIYRKQGFFSLFKGGFLRICFSVPITSLSMSLTELFKQLILENKSMEAFL